MMRSPLEVPDEEDTGPCVLVADDDPDMLREVTRALRGSGCVVVGVASADLLLDYLGRCVNFGGRFLVPDVIVSDIRMPGYSGLELLQALHEAHYDTPVILMTAFGDPRTHEEARLLGAVATFDKPFDADDLTTAIMWAWSPTGVTATKQRRRRRHSTLTYDEGLRARDSEEQHISHQDPEPESEPDAD
jgi:DNA-binding NtrC family response regulator